MNTLVVWRLVKTRHAAGAMTGEGARAYGGRWNPKGVPAIYCSTNISLAVLEVLVHTGRIESQLPGYSLIKVELDSTTVDTLEPKSLHGNWRTKAGESKCQLIGHSWAADGLSVGLRVPSAVIPEEWNVILNPRHDGFGKLVSWGKPLAYPFDQRLGRMA